MNEQETQNALAIAKTIDDLVARVALLERRLAPFARYAVALESRWTEYPDSGFYYTAKRVTGINLTYGDFRNAAIAMHAPQLIVRGDFGPELKQQERYRHKKRGSVVTVIGKAGVQAAAPISELTWPGERQQYVVVYRHNEDGQLWVRTVEEFHDGRFDRL